MVKKFDYNFDYYGNLVNSDNELAMQAYEADILPFDIVKHTHGGAANWEYDNSTGWVISYRFTKNDTTWIAASMSPESTPYFYSINYTFRDRKTFKKSRYILNCSFDRSGKLKEKRLIQNQKLLWREELLYNENKLIGFNRYKITSAGEKLDIKAINFFFTIADLPKAVTGIASIK